MCLFSSVVRQDALGEKHFGVWSNWP